MECRNIEIFVHSATDLKELNLIGKMDPYVSVSLSSDPSSEQKTEVDTDGGKKPKWKGEPMKFVINEYEAKNNGLTLVFKIMAEKPFGDKEVGEVCVPVKELLGEDSDTAVNTEKFVSYSVKTPSGKSKGTLNFSYKLSEIFTVENNTTVESVPEPVVPYPPIVAAGSDQYDPGFYSSPNPGPNPDLRPQYPDSYPHNQYGPGPYPYNPGYGYPPPQPGYGYPGSPQPGYGYPGGPNPGPGGYPNYPPGPGYGGYPVGQDQEEQKNKSNMGAVGLGVGAGLLGGLVIGEMVSDVGDFDDGSDF